MESKLIVALLVLGVCAVSTVESFKSPLILELTRCYGELGCFSIGGDFMDLRHRPLQVLPLSRNTINTKFRLYTRSFPVNGHELKAHDLWLLGRSDFLGNRSTKFITHGFLEDSTATWVHHIRRDLLIRGDYNVIEVDWGRGAMPPYTQATANTRLVGAEISLLLKFLKSNVTEFRYADVHLMGHSLGAHVSGYAGKYFKTEQLGRITGLDPAGPNFEGTKAIMRIDRTDATFVDIVHTNGDFLLKVGFGMFQPVGDIDFYPNGGKHQPGCRILDSIGNLKDRGVIETVACSHMRVLHLFRSTILTPCPYTAFRCQDYETFKAGGCLNCTKPGSCNTVGLNAKNAHLDSSAPNKYYLETGKLEPFCGYYYVVKILFSEITEAYTGRFFISQNNRMGDTTNRLAIPGEDKWFKIVPGGSVAGLQFFVRNQDEIEGLTFEWIRKRSVWDPSSWIGSSRVQISAIEVFDGATQTTNRYCSYVKLETGKTHNFVRC